MSNVEYIGFDNYSSSYCYLITFNNKFDRVKFESTFNLNFLSCSSRAEKDQFHPNSVKVIFANENDKDTIKGLIDKLLSK